MTSAALAPPPAYLFRVPKRGRHDDECEDACAADPAGGRFAVADGATESSHSGLWARLLVDDFVRQRGPGVDWSCWLPPLQDRWRAETAPEGGAMPWYAEAQYREGAFATFLGLAVEPGAWHAWAVGDSCLFQTRGPELIERFPLLTADQFTSTPWLIGSRTPADLVPRRHGGLHRGAWQPGDWLWLMTDALGQWFLSEFERGESPPWRTLEALCAAPPWKFAEWVTAERGAGRLRNDDVCLVGVFL